jgi:acetyl-CoA acetyltransferase
VAAQQAGHLAREITPVLIPQKKGEHTVVDTDEHPRSTSLEALAKLKPIVRLDGTVTAGRPKAQPHCGGAIEQRVHGEAFVSTGWGGQTHRRKPHLST